MALAEKQKLRFIYGLMERQFRRYFRMAISKRGVTGDRLMQLLETRLDNVVFRLGLATTRRMARQMVNHGYIQVNGKRVVYVLKNNLPVAVEIRLGATSDSTSEVVGGDLKEGDLVILNPPSTTFGPGGGGGPFGG